MPPNLTKILWPQLPEDVIQPHHLSDDVLNMFGGAFGPGSLALNTDDEGLTCEVSVAVGDIVYHTTDTVLATLSDHYVDTIPLGIVLEKISSTAAYILIYGQCPIDYLGLESNRYVFVSPTGEPTTSKPGGGYLYYLGWCYQENKVFVQPMHRRVKQYPF